MAPARALFVVGGVSHRAWAASVPLFDRMLKAGGNAAHGAAPLGPVQLKSFNQPVEIYRLA